MAKRGDSGRIHAFADADRWALVVECVGYNPRARNVLDVLHSYGNCLMSGKAGLDNEDFRDRIDNFEEVEQPAEPELASGATMIVRGMPVDVAAQPGEELVTVFRRLVPEHREALLAVEDELRRRVPADLPEILRLEEWSQPDLFVTRPSESETYRQLGRCQAV